ncbi:MAG TPA: AbrB/MazE/SpoVT family DNA-binding domain-containing protein [Candidatus Bathyarchaeia archaeon]|nr:AbrB/MazE/SpoVT family DNA-binding domain-containing protein [Candidatus Bathyarchaeia archaeon]
MAVGRVRKVGGSLVVTIPKELVEEEGLRPGERVNLEIRKVNKSYFGIARGVGPSPRKTSYKHMTRYVVDAYAWIEYLDGSARGARVRDLLEDSDNTILASVVKLAELISEFIRKNRDPELAMKAVVDNALVKIVDVGFFN